MCAERCRSLSAAAYFGHPADDLLMLGCHRHEREDDDRLPPRARSSRRRVTRPGLIGTIETRIGDERRTGRPHHAGVARPPEVARRDARRRLSMRSRWKSPRTRWSLHRVDGIRFAAVGFTNLSQDHLDFHATMEDYFAAKTSLFVRTRAEKGAINVDDPYGRRVLDEAPIADASDSGSPRRRTSEPPDVKLEPLGNDAHDRRRPTERSRSSTSLVGHFNVSNCSRRAAAVTLQAAIAARCDRRGPRDRSTAVPGRFESIDGGQPFAVIVDYAHTPDSLDNVLARRARR